jgi:hypothetical protein
VRRERESVYEIRSEIDRLKEKLKLYIDKMDMYAMIIYAGLHGNVYKKLNSAIIKCKSMRELDENKSIDLIDYGYSQIIAPDMK